MRLLFALLCTTCALSADPLLNKGYIAAFLTKEAPWHTGHLASEDYLGCGLLYFALAYTSQAKTCVCLGSGGGFVPRVMRQAQRELNLENARTILVDADMGPWGRPQWLSDDSFFRTHFPDVEILMQTTHEASLQWDPTVKIDYLHIDADHSAEGSLQDFLDYLPLMAPSGIITFHDTNGSLPCAKTAEQIREMGYEIVNFKEFGAGVAIIHLGE